MDIAFPVQLAMEKGVDRHSQCFFVIVGVRLLNELAEKDAGSTGRGIDHCDHGICGHSRGHVGPVPGESEVSENAHVERPTGRIQPTD